MSDNEWQARGNCAGYMPDTMYPVGRQGAGEAEKVERRVARDVCKGCPVVDICLEDALTQGINDQHGVWGGKTANERRTIIRSRRTPNGSSSTGPATCGTLGGHSAHRRDKTPVCEPCRKAAATYQAAARLRRLSEKASA